MRDLVANGNSSIGENRRPENKERGHTACFKARRGPRGHSATQILLTTLVETRRGYPLDEVTGPGKGRIQGRRGSGGHTASTSGPFTDASNE